MGDTALNGALLALRTPPLECQQCARELESLMPDVDPFESPEWMDYAQHARDELFPKLSKSAFMVSIVEGTPDVKFCLELGAAIMLDKPIIALVMPGANVPDRLRRIANGVVEFDVTDPASQERATRQVKELVARLLHEEHLDEPDEKWETPED